MMNFVHTKKNRLVYRCSNSPLAARVAARAVPAGTRDRTRRKRTCTLHNSVDHFRQHDTAAGVSAASRAPVRSTARTSAIGEKGCHRARARGRSAAAARADRTSDSRSPCSPCRGRRQNIRLPPHRRRTQNRWQSRTFRRSRTPRRVRRAAGWFHFWT